MVVVVNCHIEPSLRDPNQQLAGPSKLLQSVHRCIAASGVTPRPLDPSLSPTSSIAAKSAPPSASSLRRAFPPELPTYHQPRDPKASQDLASRRLLSRIFPISHHPSPGCPAPPPTESPTCTAASQQHSQPASKQAAPDRHRQSDEDGTPTGHRPRIATAPSLVPPPGISRRLLHFASFPLGFFSKARNHEL